MLIALKGFLPALNEFGLDKDKEKAFVIKMMLRGLETLEKLVGLDGNYFCVGDSLTIADLFFVPQMRNITEVWKIDISDYPRCNLIYRMLKIREVFVSTHPEHLVEVAGTLVRKPPPPDSP